MVAHIMVQLHTVMLHKLHLLQFKLHRLKLHQPLKLNKPTFYKNDFYSLKKAVSSDTAFLLPAIL
jgi:hypothetical protein